ncbi:PadR family transcriptional regulator [Rhizomonospora bruguierae]|uniref:PadR family transcriptional regulator n=1 Tax=Rhizomonospora bruguierae TaxID=1581705 RepID=UPI001BCA9DE6|nr:helix-turn-helix transcriptional regulator [Micromonospora sp. NBRC 107566]
MRGNELRALLHPLLLLLIFERPSHGYDLIERLCDLGVPDIEPGQVYRMLRGMESGRAVVSVWETARSGPARRRYELTAKGLGELQAWSDRLSRLGGVIDVWLGRWATASDAPHTVPHPSGVAAPR